MTQALQTRKRKASVRVLSSVKGRQVINCRRKQGQSGWSEYRKTETHYVGQNAMKPKKTGMWG